MLCDDLSDIEDSILNMLEELRSDLTPEQKLRVNKLIESVELIREEISDLENFYFNGGDY
jgi:hypothetical protein